MADLGVVFDRFESGDLSKSPNIKDFSVFDFSYVPQSPLIRPETERIAESLLRYHQTTIARNLVVIGPRGCGKTVTLRHLGKYFLGRGVALPFYTINCRVNSTSFKVLAEILRVRPRGYSFSELCSQFEREIPSPAIIVLDEAEMLADKGGRNDVLYFLSRSPKRYSIVLL
jgi:Cdc6-like AAA superfamily ATPase